MTTETYSLRSALVSTLTGIKRPDVPVPVALRNTAAVALPLAAGFASGHPAIGLAIGAGALNVMFSDQPGPYLQRLQLIGTVALAAALSALVGFLVGDRLPLLIAAVALWGFLAGMLVLFGPNMTRVGMASMILLVITAATPLPWRQALGASALILAGGALQALFSIAAWPLQRYRPERLALAEVYRELARLARRQPQDNDAPPVTDALTRLQQTLLGRGPARGRAMEAFYALLELAERMRLELMALAEPHMGSERHARFRIDAARVLDAIAEALHEAEPPARAERALQTLDTTAIAVLGGTRPRPHGPLLHVHALTGQLAAAVRNANWAGSRGEMRARAADTAMPRALRNAAPLAALRANLNFSSVGFRHALRLSVALAAALAISRYAGLAHGYWLPMTAAIVLRPDFGATFKFGLLRVLGTILGLVLTTALLRLAPDSVWPHLALMTVLCFTFRYLAAAHYGVAVAALTGTVVILLSFEGVASGAAVTERVVNTALGSGMALLAYLAWPTWERGRARTTLADMLAAYAHYLHSLSVPAQASERRDARAAARAARSNAQASLERLRAEPATTPELMELATTLFANGNRLVRTGMALEALLDDSDDLPCADTLAGFVDSAEHELRALADALREGRHASLPASRLRPLQHDLAAQLRGAADHRASESLVAVSDRLADNIGTLVHVLARTATPRAPGAA